jgi:hypothetical protein
MATVSAVVDRAANDLGLLKLGQTLQAQDSTRITSAYNEVYAQLKKDGLATWTSTGDIPADLVQHVVTLVADNCVNTYGVSDSRYKRLKMDVPAARREIRKLTAPNYVSMDNAQEF